MNLETVIRLLQNAGFHVIGADNSYLYLENPSCVLRSLENFIEYAWIIIATITAFLLFGWAIAMIRGSKNSEVASIAKNIRTLLIIFGTLAAAGPLVNLIYGDDLIGRGCGQIKVKLADVQKMLDVRNDALNRHENESYEVMNIYDTGAVAANTDNGEQLPDPVVINDNANSAGNSAGDANNAAGGSDNNASPQPVAQNGAGATSATESGKDVIYTDRNGKRYRRTGGTRAWRNNNPGNIRFSDFSRRAGAIGRAGGFAVFPDEETGMRAITSLLQSKSYRNLTVAGAINRWAPPSENNTAAYQRKLSQLANVSLNARISELNNEQLSRVANAIRTIEGWKPGKTVDMS